MAGNPYKDHEKLLNQIEVLRDQVKKLTAGELHQYELQERLDSQLRTQEEIINLGYRIQTVHDDEEIANLVTEALVESFDYEKAALYIWDEFSHRFKLAGREGYYGERDEESSRNSIQDLTETLNDGKGPDIIVQHDMPGTVMGMDDRVVLVCRGRERTVRSLVVFGNSKARASYQRQIEEQDRTLWETILRMTSSALENALLYKQLAMEREDLKRAHDNLRNLNDELEKIVQDRTAELARSREEFRLLYLESERTSQNYRSLLDSTADPIVVYDDKGLPVYFNPAFVRVFGWKFDEVKSGKFSFIPDGIEKEAEELIRLVASGEKISNFETKRLTKDGLLRDVSISAAAHFNVRGQYAGCIFQLRDITERKLLEEELLKMRKLESIGLLAGGIAHDFNNILSGILMNSQMARLKVGKGEDASKFLLGIDAATDRAVKLTQQLLTFAKGGAPVKKSTSIEKFIREVVEFALHGSNVKCEFDIKDDIWPVEIDEGQINQVIQNLIINAQQAMPNGGVVRVAVSNDSLDKALDVSGLYKFQKRDFVRISIQDTGVGIPKENLWKIFDPYFTTKEKSTGLGLATTYSIITRHNGYLSVESEEGSGSTFTFYLPVSKEAPRKTGDEKARETAHDGGGAVLVMDDEEMIRDLMSEMLNAMGYSVDQAQDGRETLDLYAKAKEKGNPYSLIIMDLTIPGGMGGKETIAEIRKRDPDVKVIVSSGYSNDPVMADYREYGFQGVLRKPFKMEDLKSMLLSVKV